MRKIGCKDIPNILSIVRIVLVFVFIWVFFKKSPRVALTVFVLAGITDIIDGYLARRCNWISDAGKILDPLADKLMQCAVLICLTATNMIGLWFVLPYIVKEMIVLFGGLFMIKSRKTIVVSNFFGKFAAVVFYTVICLVMLFSAPWQTSSPLWVSVICAVSLCCTVIAMVAYMLKYLSVKSDDVSEDDHAETPQTK